MLKPTKGRHINQTEPNDAFQASLSPNETEAPPLRIESHCEAISSALGLGSHESRARDFLNGILRTILPSLRRLRRNIPNRTSGQSINRRGPGEYSQRMKARPSPFLR